MSNETNEVIVSQRNVDNLMNDKIDERIDQHLSNDSEFEEYEEEVEDDDLISELEAAQNYDIFDDVINKRIELGDVIKWRVIKDGELIQTKSGKGSWDEIHKDFGRGTYQIRPRSQQLRKFLKTQTLTLADYSGDSKDIETAKENSFDMNSFLSHQREERQWANEEASRREDKAEARFEKQLDLINSNNNNNSSGSSFEFMKMMMDQNNRQDEIRRNEQIRRDDQALLKEEKAEARFEKLLVTLSANKADDSKISAIDHFEKIRTAEKEAKEEARREFDEIETKAAAKAAEMSENSGEKSITEKGIEALMETAPLLAKIYAKNTGATAAPTRRRVMPPKRVQNPIKVVGLSTENSNTVVNSQKTTKINESEADEKKAKAKAFILELCSPIILESIVAEQDASECAVLCTDKLAEVEINAEIIKHIFAADDFIGFSKEQGLHDLAIAHNKVEQLESWLKELYELLSKPIITKEVEPQIVVVNSQPTL